MTARDRPVQKVPPYLLNPQSITIHIDKLLYEPFARMVPERGLQLAE
jgi:hypothetical protein